MVRKTISHRTSSGTSLTSFSQINRFIAFLYDVYLATFGLDLWPARKTVGHKFDPSLVEQDKLNTLHHHKDGRPGQPGGIDLDQHLGVNGNNGMNDNYDRPSVSDSQTTYINTGNGYAMGGGNNGMTPLELSHAKADGYNVRQV